MRAIQLKLTNIYYIALGFFSIVVGFIGSLILGLGLIFEEFFVTFGFVLVGFFTYETYHKNSGRIPKLVLLSIIIISSIHFIYQIYFTLNPGVLTQLISKTLDIIKTFTVFYWLGISSYRAYDKIKEEDVHKWIKVRYKLIAISAVIMSIQPMPELFMPYNVEYGDPQNVITFIVFTITLVIALIFSTGFLVSWIMPESIKRYIDRNYQEHDFQDLTELEIIQLIKEDLNKKNS